MQETIDRLIDEFKQHPEQALTTPMPELLAAMRKDHAELDEEAFAEVREGIHRAFAEYIKKRDGKHSFAIIELPDKIREKNPDELYIVKICTWSEYKSLMGGKKTRRENEELQANEEYVQNFLVYPSPKLEFMQDMLPGKMAALANKIIDALGFATQGGAIKNV
jgi:predicted RNase H-like nuclease